MQSGSQQEEAGLLEEEGSREATSGGWEGTSEATDERGEGVIGIRKSRGFYAERFTAGGGGFVGRGG
jgi:hypothetical protein